MNAMMRWILFCFCVLAMPAHAGVQLERTRLVYAQGETEISLRIRNQEAAPVLIQAWVNDFGADAPPEQANSPFIVTPPIRRLDPDASMSFRIRLTDASTLPDDRESMFWLNVVDIPATPVTRNDEATLAVLVRSRIKLIYRPASLRAVASEAPKTLTWRWSRRNGKPVMVVNNPSPFYVNANAGELITGGRTVALAVGVVAPFAEKEVAVDGELADLPSSLRFRWLDDWGTPHDTGAAIAE